MAEVIKLEIPVEQYKRLVKIVKCYETSRLKCRANAQRRLEKEREELVNKLKEANLESLIKKSKKREEPLIAPLSLEQFVVSDNAPIVVDSPQSE